MLTKDREVPFIYCTGCKEGFRWHEMSQAAENHLDRHKMKKEKAELLII